MVCVHIALMERSLHQDFVVWYGNNYIGMHVGTGYVVRKRGLKYRGSVLGMLVVKLLTLCICCYKISNHGIFAIAEGHIHLLDKCESKWTKILLTAIETPYTETYLTMWNTCHGKKKMVFIMSNWMYARKIFNINFFWSQAFVFRFVNVHININCFKHWTFHQPSKWIVHWSIISMLLKGRLIKNQCTVRMSPITPS